METEFWHAIASWVIIIGLGVSAWFFYMYLTNDDDDGAL